MMVFFGNRFFNDKGGEEVGSGTYHGEEKVEGDDEIDSDDGNKSKENSTPLWKYVTKPVGGKGGGTTKFTYSHL